MCGNFYDIRTFGAVMTTEVNCGQVRGPVQINFARSIEPIVPLEISITRMAVTNERDLEKERTMGRKHIVPYALYRAEGYISAKLAEQTGFSDGDLTLLWEALINMFDHDHSAARGKMNARGLFVFKHDSALGNAPAHKLFSLVTVRRSEADNSPSRSFSDYAVAADRGGLPAGVALQEML
jgi:CRISPR-associated protein Csd2